MSNDGKELEKIVADIEMLLLGSGYTVKSNDKVYDTEGYQVAEFDITIEGKVGSTTFNWLIECRDRPSQGPAPGSWIEQLSGRKHRYGFDKVIAVSTTKFSPSAVDSAKDLDVVLREVKNVQDISSCFGSIEFRVVEKLLFLNGAADFDFSPRRENEQAKNFGSEAIVPKVRYVGEAVFLALKDFVSQDHASNNSVKQPINDEVHEMIYNVQGNLEAQIDGQIFGLKRISVPVTVKYSFHPSTILTVKSYGENGDVIGEEATIVSETNNHIVRNKVLITRQGTEVDIRSNGPTEVTPK